MIVFKKKSGRALPGLPVVDPHTVKAPFQRTVKNDDRDPGAFQRLLRPASSTDRDNDHPIHLFSKQKGNVLRLQIFILIGITDQEPVPLPAESYPDVTNQRPCEQALHKINDNPDRLCPAGHESPRNFIHFIMQLLHSRVDLLTVFRKHIAPIQILGDRRQ